MDEVLPDWYLVGVSVVLFGIGLWALRRLPRGRA
jgi:hypothetical protein